MADEPELTPDETQEVEQPADSPQEGTPAPESEHSDYEQRYKDLQSTYTQSQQELAEYRDYMEKLNTDEEVQRETLRQLANRFNIALPEDEEPEYTDPGEQALVEFREWRAEQERQAKEAAEAKEQAEYWDTAAESFHDALDAYQSENNVKLTDGEVKFLGARVLLEGASPEDVFKEWNDVGQGLYERIVASKKAPRASKGTQGSPKFDPSSPEELEAMAEQVAQEALLDSE